MKKEIIKLKISDLKPYENNHNSHEKNLKHIKNSIKDFSYTTYIEVDENNEILAGHGRLLALEVLGEEEIDVMRIYGMDENQKKAYRIAHNTTQLASEIDKDTVREEYSLIDGYEASDYGYAIECDESDFPELKEGDKDSFHKMTFLLSEDQADKIKEAIAKYKKSESYEHLDKTDNENSNSNALFGIIQEWLM